LGLHIRGTSLHLDPCIPKTWSGFGIVFRYRSARYEIKIENPQSVDRGVVLVELDGEVLMGGQVPIPLADDGMTHFIKVVLG
jgi:cyclic beta-1,2-glucan synthetase